MTLAIIRLRGSVNTSTDVEYALKSLNLTRVNHCSLVNDSPSLRGMLKRVRDYATYGDVHEETLKELIAKRGRKVGDKKLSAKEVDDVLKSLKEGKTLKQAGIKPLFRLRPARKGLKDTKKHYPRGDLGDRGEAINDLLKRMM
ncbi:50S ribosomal protein L30 [archaeon CG10_big_fil_rev_8_21_14_0_10_43_11]|nr:MAG: 50S ribosomal protein L30 [archaeon CG10_big_fil_rev_8_21_14_0_10_43_11]